MSRDYELGLIIDPEVGDERTRAIVERVTQTIGANSGQVVRVNAWGRRRLAYPIDRHRDGLYFYFDLILEPTSVTEVERSLRVNEDVLRHLLKVRDSRVVAQQRLRDAEAEAQAALEAQQAEAARQAEAERAAAAPVAEAAPAETAPIAPEPAPVAEAEPVAETEPEVAAPVETPAPVAEQEDESGATIPSEAEAKA
ncbi:MAG TPA: 30S ribosomal protein S6 [Ktedonobacterales bacterium]|nr:30S ribosomal protein S6 [Ktedonobacterales bacterium]